MVLNTPNSIIIPKKNLENSQSLGATNKQFTSKVFRKPLSDRSNLNINGPNEKLKSSCSQKMKTNVDLKSHMQSEDDYIFDIIDGNYFKEEPDTEEEIWPKHQRLSMYDLDLITKSFTYQNLPSTPPPALSFENIPENVFTEVELSNNDDSGIEADNVLTIYPINEPNISELDFYFDDIDIF